MAAADDENTTGAGAAGDWAERYARTIARRLRTLRDQRGISAQTLSDRCTELGMPLARAVISHLENGRRENVTIAEVFILAKALDATPADLLTGPDVPVEVLPGVALDRQHAVCWIAGIPGPAELAHAAATIHQARTDLDRALRTAADAADTLGALTARHRPLGRPDDGEHLAGWLVYDDEHAADPRFVLPPGTVFRPVYERYEPAPWPCPDDKAATAAEGDDN